MSYTLVGITTAVVVVEGDMAALTTDEMEAMAAVVERGKTVGPERSSENRLQVNIPDNIRD